MEIPSEYAGRVNVRDSGCWEWTGWTYPARYPNGVVAHYGVLQRAKKQYYAHRYFFQLATGIDPGEQVIHHKCENTLCMNPDHLEMLTRKEHALHHDAFAEINAENLARETCKNGHPWREETTYMWKTIRHCRICNRDAMRAWREARDLQRKPKTHCPHGHALEGENLKITKQGWRQCNECSRVSAREAQRRVTQRKKAAQATNTG